MKKLLYLLALAVTFSMVACDDNKGNDDVDDEIEDEIEDATYVDFLNNSANFA
jgi:hypothetical protein